MYTSSSSSKFFRQGGNAWNLFDFDNQSAAVFVKGTIKYCSIPSVPSGLEKDTTSASVCAEVKVLVLSLDMKYSRNNALNRPGRRSYFFSLKTHPGAFTRCLGRNLE